MILVGGGVAKRDGSERAISSRQLGLRAAQDDVLGDPSMANDVADVDGRDVQAGELTAGRFETDVPTGLVEQRGLNRDARQTRLHGEIDGGLGMADATKNSALASAQRRHMPGLTEPLSAQRWVRQCADRANDTGGGRGIGPLIVEIDRNREPGLPGVRWARAFHHQGDVECVQAIGSHGDEDRSRAQSAQLAEDLDRERGPGRHEVDLGLVTGIVHDRDDAAGGHGVGGALDRGLAHGAGSAPKPAARRSSIDRVAPSPRTSRSTYLASTSASTLARYPDDASPSVTIASV